MHLANILSLVLFLGFVLQFSLVEQPRRNVPQLDSSQVNYCQLEMCDEVFGVQLDNGASAKEDATQQSLGVLITLEFTNLARYEGERELWIRLVSPNGELVEMASTVVDFDLKKRTSANFLVTGLKAEILAGNLYLGY
mgnify:CR=1 FL=1